jgi:HAD superfamily hydrolase (TIGR01549 family)
MAAIEACLLDYGNTIIEFDQPQIESIRARFAETLGALFEPTSIERIAESHAQVCNLPFAGDPPEYRETLPFEQMRVWLGLLYGEERVFPDELVRDCDAALQELFVSSIQVDDATVRLLDALRRRVPVGLVSNYPCGEALRRSLKETGIEGLLDPIVISGEVGYVKPHPSVFEAALRPLGVAPDSVLFVGDRWDLDMLGARDVGMRTCHHIGYTSDLRLDARYQTYRPDYQIRSLQDLEDIVLGVEPLRTRPAHGDNGDGAS